MSVLTLPYNWTPRGYQLSALEASDRGCRRIVTVWHRRAGKDTTALQQTIKKAAAPRGMGGRVGAYYHLFPTLQQGRRILWDGRGTDGTGDGRPVRSYFPPELVLKVNEAEMKIVLRHPEKPTQEGSVWQIVGAKEIDSLVGPNPVGIVLSEYSLQNPGAWDLLRPILSENGGWAWFTYTPRGRNHGYYLYQHAAARMAAGDPDWFAQLLTVDQTCRCLAVPGATRQSHRPDCRPVITPEAIEEDRQSGMSDALIEQEYYCSFNAAIQGAIYGDLMAKAREEGRIVTHLPYEPHLGLVETWWDLGTKYNMAVWAVQRTKLQLRVLRFYTSDQSGFAHYAAQLQSWGFEYGAHYGPHDLAGTEIGTGKTRLEEARACGIAFKVVPRLHAHKGQEIREGINAVRRLLPRAVFDATGCGDVPGAEFDLKRNGIAALEMYRRRYDEERKVFVDEPVHDWTSHAADAFRTGAVAYRDPLEEAMRPSTPPQQVTYFNPYTYDRPAAAVGREALDPRTRRFLELTGRVT